MHSRSEWKIEQEKRKMLQEEMVTENKKNKFINDIKSGLGQEILQKTNKVYEKPNFWVKIKKVLGWN